MLYIIGATVLFFLFYYSVYGKFIYIDTVSAAIVMAIGVFSVNIIPQFTSNSLWYKGVALTVLVIWAIYMTSYMFSLITKNFKSLHYESIIGRFRIGTWVAGTSVTVIIISNYFPAFNRMIIPLVILNTLLWVCFFFSSIRSILLIFKNKYINNVSGILFLTTVSTQSLVLMYNNVWGSFHQLFYINIMLIAIGFLFYLLCITLIIQRYTKYSWQLISDWKAPNCMVHGALSILGSAAVISKSLSIEMVLILWIIVVILFAANEIVEIVRAVFRTKVFGWIDGLCIYHPSQWSRIFTFCMFYTFTLKFNTSFDIQTPWLVYSQQTILAVGKWIIVILLIIEIGLLIRAQFPTSKRIGKVYSHKLSQEV